MPTLAIPTLWGKPWTLLETSHWLSDAIHIKREVLIMTWQEMSSSVSLARIITPFPVASHPYDWLAQTRSTEVTPVGFSDTVLENL